MGLESEETMKPPRHLTTARSTDKILRQINAELDRLNVRKDQRDIIVDAVKNRCGLRFRVDVEIDQKSYHVVVAKISESQSRVQDNLAALHLWLRGRNVNIERKIEGLEEAFGAHVDVKMSNLPPGFGEHLLAVKSIPGLVGPIAQR